MVISSDFLILRTSIDLTNLLSRWPKGDFVTNCYKIRTEGIPVFVVANRIPVAPDWDVSLARPERRWLPQAGW